MSTYLDDLKTQAERWIAAVSESSSNAHVLREAALAVRKLIDKASKIELDKDGFPILHLPTWHATVEQCRQIVLECTKDAHEASKAKDATDYVAGYQDGVVDADEALRDLLQRVHPLPEASQRSVPEGWKLVPLEATEAMLDAALNAINSEDDDTAGVFKAMAMAAPAPSPISHPLSSKEKP